MPLPRGRGKGLSLSPADRRRCITLRRSGWTPPPQPPAAGTVPPLPQQLEEKVEKTFWKLALPHFGHFSRLFRA